MCGHMISRAHVCCRPVSPTTLWVCQQIHLCCRVLSGVIPYDCAHTCVLPQAGVRGRSLRLRGLRMFLSSSAPVHVRQKQASIRCDGSCNSDCADMCIELQGVRCHGPLRSVRVLNSRVPREAHVRSQDCWCGACVFAHTHTHVCFKSKKFVVMPRLAVTC